MSPIMHVGERPGPDLSWYVAQVFTGLEDKIKDALGEVDIDAFVPHEVVWHTPPRGKRTRKSQPLLPGYMFVYLPEPRPRFRTVREIEGVVAFLGVHDPLPISADVVRDIHEAELAGRFDVTHRKHDRYQPGDRVRMLSGVGAGFIATVQEMTPEGRVALLWTLFGRPAAVRLDQDDLEPVAQDVEQAPRQTAKA